MSAKIFTLAHISDVHLGPLPRLGLRHWNAKRMLGYANWVRNRRLAHLPDTLRKIVTDLLSQEADHIAVTGDLVNIGLPDEYEAAAGWLRSLGAPDHVSVVPGNHDIYTRSPLEEGVGKWAPYMRSHGSSAGHFDLDVFPYVRRFEGISLIGLNSAVPTPVFRAYGRLGAKQLERLGPVLDAERARGVVRVLMIHHPPLGRQASPAKRLTDASDLETVLGRHGADLILHGHNHKASVIEQDLGPDAGRTVIVGVPSASLGRVHGAETLARYNLYRLHWIDNGRVAIECVSRGLSRPDGDVVDMDRWRLSSLSTHGPRVDHHS